MISNQKTILYVEDDADDREFFSESIREIAEDVKVDFATNGLEALEYLEDRSKTPCLIVLDLNLPFVNGTDIYCRLKDDEFLKTVPVIIFSSSERPQDKQFFSNLGVEFFSKPTNIHSMNSIASSMVSVCG